MNLISQKDINKIKVNLQGSGINIDKLISEAISRKKIVLVCGPTCCGKSKIALNLAHIFKSHIISVDSMQVYKRMDIGTDKYETESLGIHQYMTDIFDPDYYVTAVEFRDICRKIIEDDFFSKKKIPIIAGGSGLYIRAVVDNLEFSADKKIKNNNLCFQKSFKDNKTSIEPGLKINENIIAYNELKKIDPSYAQKISINDSRRILRALEVFKTTGKCFSEFQKNWNERKSVYNTSFIGIIKEKENLHNCIENRIKDMLKKGLIEEVLALVRSGFKNFNSLKQAVGYKETIYFLEGQSTLEECIKKIARNTKKLAKKQMTWFKADDRINWIRADEYDNIIDLISDIIKVIWKDLRNE